MGEYRRLLGWGYGRKNNSELDTAHKLRYRVLIKVNLDSLKHFLT
jgi:hypothetical protein